MSGLQVQGNAAPKQGFTEIMKKKLELTNKLNEIQISFDKVNTEQINLLNSIPLSGDSFDKITDNE